MTIPRLELCGALLLSKLIVSVAVDLDVPREHLYACCDSAVVLGWLNMVPTKLRVFAANRVGDIGARIPAEQWRYVATDLNPADCASRGLPPCELIQKELWWKGPPWLQKDPELWPRCPDINLSRELPELRIRVLTLQPANDFWWNRYSSFDRLLRTVAWLRRFVHNCTHQGREKADRLTTRELDEARKVLLRLSQAQTFSDVLGYLRKGNELPRRCQLLALRPLVDDNGLLRVGGRLQKADLGYDTAHPLILNVKSGLVRLLAKQVHPQAKHAGPAAMLAILAEQYCIPGDKKLLRAISRSCTACQQAYAHTATQMMGQLPADRVRPAPPFSVVGLDFAGPFLCKRGNPRKPTLVKAYACVFVCFVSKAVHLELVSDLTTDHRSLSCLPLQVLHQTRMSLQDPLRQRD